MRHQFFNQEEILEWIQREYSVPIVHNKKGDRSNDPFIQTSKELYVLRKLIKNNCSPVSYPIQLLLTNHEESFPDFIVKFGDEVWIVEVTELTDGGSQVSYSAQQPRVVISSGLNLTEPLQNLVNKKNSKIAAYKSKVGDIKSLLLINYDMIRALCFDPVCDALDRDEIYSNFDKTILFMRICNSLTDEDQEYLEL